MKCKERTKNDGLKRFANEMETAEGDENVNGDSPRPTSSSPSPERIDEKVPWKIAACCGLLADSAIVLESKSVESQPAKAIRNSR
jgi:hypothetical protein